MRCAPSPARWRRGSRADRRRRSAGARAADPRHPVGLLPRHRARDGLGRRRLRLQGGALAAGAAAGARARARRRGRVPRRARRLARGRPALDLPHRRAPRPRGVRGGAGAAPRGAAAHLGLAAGGGEPLQRVRALRPAGLARLRGGAPGRPGPPHRDGTRLLLRAGAAAMVTSRALYLGFLLLLAAERLFEVALSRRNAARALARGGRESGQAHFPVMVALHTAFLAAFAAALGAQALRYWAVASLGDRWNVRVIVVPGDVPVQRGPYRLVRHPNYAAVVLEMLAVPLVHGCWATALVFSALHLVVLRVRIRAEETALGAAWQDAFAGRPRFLPGGHGRG